MKSDRVKSAATEVGTILCLGLITVGGWMIWPAATLILAGAGGLALILPWKKARR